MSALVEQPVVVLHDVRVRYGTVTALEHASVSLAAGRVTGLVGVNGSGKSTLMKSILGLVSPDGGSVQVLGGSVDAARKASKIAYVAQSEAIDEKFPISVRQVVEMGRYGALGVTRRLRAPDVLRCNEAMRRTGVLELEHRSIGELSGGQRKRVFLARAIAQDAAVMLLDEPFSGVDATSQAAIVGVIRQLAAEGVCVLVSSHDISSLPELCDTVVLWYHRALFEGPPAEALNDHNLAQAFAAGVRGGASDTPGDDGRSWTPMGGAK
ncbi:metal ABC transporter ATP-binding protein [Lysinibacter cavernae]|uniref:Manganese transport system ATP-binding protein n=1 Tax=Lysinibacter cavernae TaxID=1640652 RepID=A0A7X5QYR1_9MICO|nr:metal ABC transporter ATP-binding protein [Lysinibacter cavernae]NIH52470.1 manganese transport system ATP-binding protein [Lysinibacter cavernae]